MRVKDVKNGRKSPEDIFVALTPIKMEINPSTSTAIGKTTSIVSKGTKRSHCVQDANNEMGLSDLETKQTLSRVSGKSATKRRDENDFESLNVGKQGMRRSKSWKATLSHSNNDAKSSDTENNEMVHPVDSKTARKNRKEGEFQSLISMKRKMRLRMNSQKAGEQTEDSEVESSDAESGVSACSHRLRGRRATRNTKKDDLESLNVKNRKATGQVKNRAVANLTISEVQSSCIESKEMKTGSDKFGETVNEEKIHSENERTSSSVLSPKPMTKTSVNIKPNTRFQAILRHKNRGRDITTKKLDRAVSKEQGTRVLVTSENDGELRDKDTKVQGKMGTKQLGKTGIQKNRSNKSHNLCKKTVCTRSADTVTDEEMWDEDEHERLIGSVPKVLLVFYFLLQSYLHNHSLFSLLFLSFVNCHSFHCFLLFPFPSPIFFLSSCISIQTNDTSLQKLFQGAESTPSKHGNVLAKSCTNCQNTKRRRMPTPHSKPERPHKTKEKDIPEASR